MYLYCESYLSFFLSFLSFFSFLLANSSSSSCYSSFSLSSLVFVPVLLLHCLLLICRGPRPNRREGFDFAGVESPAIITDGGDRISS